MKNVEDLYPLTPMQRVMLLHSAASRGSDALHDQFCYELVGRLDVDAFRGAWQDVAARHAALRTGFVWDDLESPLQLVRRSVDLVVEELDWRRVPEEERAAALDGLLAEDRARGFALDAAPLTRATVARTSDDRAYLVWSSHHLVLDRWCIGVVLEDLARAYDARTGRAGHRVAPRAGRFRDYVAWIEGQDRSEAMAAWAADLEDAAGCFRSLAGSGAGARNGAHGRARARARIDTDLAGAVRALARGAGVTPSVVLQGAWALVMNEVGRRQDVVFGATVSGRPPELPDVETTVGSFVGNVPVRVRMPAEETVGAWLTDLQRRQQRRAPREFLSAADIHAASGLPANEQLFDALLVWLAPVAWTPPAELSIEPMEGGVTTTWPLTLSVQDEGDALDLSLDRAQGTADPAALLALLEAKLRALVAGAEQRLVDLEGFAVDDVSSDESESRPAGRSGRPLPATRCADSPAARGREEDELEMVEQMILAECRTLLGHDGIEPTHNFFEAGGNSLLAAHLHAQLEGIMGRTVPILPLFRAADLREMARFLTEREWPVRGDMVRSIQPHGARTPLHCFSSPEVNSLGYVLLARHMDPDQPVHLVQSPPSADDVRRMAITEIPDLAARYVEALRSDRPNGPYRILGMCDGALIALEAARQLTASGETVEFLGVLNTHSLNTLSWRNRIRRVEVRLQYYRTRLGGLRRLTWRERRGELDRVLRQRLRVLSRASSAERAPADGAARRKDALSGASVAADAAAHTDESVHREWQELDWPHRNAPTSKYGGTVTVFRIERQPYFRVRDRDLGWGRHAESVDVVELGTAAQDQPLRDRREWRESHLDILREPDVRRTARSLMTSLARIDREQPA
ncbi:MAG: condensation domain-containing protein [Planctomycetota bacterium]